MNMKIEHCGPCWQSKEVEFWGEKKIQKIPSISDGILEIDLFGGGY